MRPSAICPAITACKEPGRWDAPGFRKGLRIHSVLARDAKTEELLGCAYQYTFVRQPAPEKETKGEQKQRARESQVWEQSVRAYRSRSLRHPMDLRGRPGQ